jgi:hypothetical protein
VAQDPLADSELAELLEGAAAEFAAVPEVFAPPDASSEPSGAVAPLDASASGKAPGAGRREISRRTPPAPGRRPLARAVSRTRSCPPVPQRCEGHSAPPPGEAAVSPDWRAELARYADVGAADAFMDVSRETFPVLRALTALLGLPDEDCVRAAASAVVQRSPLLLDALDGHELLPSRGEDPGTVPVLALAVSLAFRRDLLLLDDGTATRLGWGFGGPLLSLCAATNALCAVRGTFRSDVPSRSLRPHLGPLADLPAHALEI